MVTFALIEEQKAALISRVISWSEESLNFRPRASEWSALEIFDHLVRTESSILKAARMGLSAPRRIRLSDRLRMALLTALFRSRTRVKVPGRVTQILPGPTLNFSDVRSRWGDVRKELAAFLEAVPAEQRCKGIFEHPVGGWMNSDGILTFFSVHMIHHSYQIERLFKAMKSRMGAEHLEENKLL
jgi:hypothetical protein